MFQLFSLDNFVKHPPILSLGHPLMVTLHWFSHTYQVSSSPLLLKLGPRISVPQNRPSIDIASGPEPNSVSPLISKLALIYCSKALMWHGVFFSLNLIQLSKRLIEEALNQLIRIEWSPSSSFSSYNLSILNKIQSNLLSLSLYSDTKLSSMLPEMPVAIHLIVLLTTFCSAGSIQAIPTFVVSSHWFPIAR